MSQDTVRERIMKGAAAKLAEIDSDSAKACVISAVEQMEKRSKQISHNLRSARDGIAALRVDIREELGILKAQVQILEGALQEVDLFLSGPYEETIQKENVSRFEDDEDPFK
jgi:hypothetical protein